MRKFQADVTVLPKDGVLDIQGKAVENTLISNGFSEVSDIRVGRFVRFAIGASDEAAARARVSEIADDLLANDLIESYTFTLEPMQ